MKLEEKVRQAKLEAERYAEAARKWLLTAGGMTNGIALQEAQENLKRALNLFEEPQGRERRCAEIAREGMRCPTGQAR